MAVIQKSEEYIYKYEMVLKEREEEAKWKETRFQRFKNTQNVIQTLRTNLIRAAYPRGGEIATSLLGVKDKIENSRKDENFDTF